MMNSSRQSDVNSAAYGYGDVGNYNNPNNANHYYMTGVQPPSINYMSGGGGGGYNNYAGPGSNPYAHSNLEKAYSVVNTEPVMVAKDRQIILVDPILEPHVKSYLTWSLINVFFCCCLGGFITTILSCNVMRLNDDKRYKEALKLSGIVLLANMIATGLGALIFLIVFPYIYIAIYPYLPKINY